MSTRKLLLVNITRAHKPSHTRNHPFRLRNTMASARELIDASPLSSLKVRVILLCTLVNMAEGYDILSMSLAILPITDDWGISGLQSGTLSAPASSAWRSARSPWDRSATDTGAAPC